MTTNSPGAERSTVPTGSGEVGPVEEGSPTILIVSGFNSADTLRALIQQAAMEVDAVCLAEVPNPGEYLVRNMLEPFEIKDIRPPRHRERPAHERIAAQKRK